MPLRQSRLGSQKRRELEFRTITHHVRRDKPGFIKRLQRRCVAQPDGCVCYRATSSDGYPLISFRYHKSHVVMKAARCFLILQLARPIKLGYDAGHEPSCKRRDCVRHVFEQHALENSAAVAGGYAIPF